MGRPTLRTDDVIKEVLDRVGNGETLQSVFQDDHLPSRQTFWRWCDDDAELDALLFRSIRRGKIVHADIAASTQLKIMNGDHDDDPKTLQAKVTAANNLGHQALAQLSKLDNRYKDKQEITHTGPMVLGWQDDTPVDDKVMPDEYLDYITPETSAN